MASVPIHVSCVAATTVSLELLALLQVTQFWLTCVLDEGEGCFGAAASPPVACPVLVCSLSTISVLVIMSTDAKQLVFGFPVTLLQRAGENDLYFLKDVLAALNVDQSPSRVLRSYKEGVDYMYCYEVLKHGCKGYSGQKLGTLDHVRASYNAAP